MIPTKFYCVLFLLLRRRSFVSFYCSFVSGLLLIDLVSYLRHVTFAAIASWFDVVLSGFRSLPLSLWHVCHSRLFSIHSTGCSSFDMRFCPRVPPRRIVQGSFFITLSVTCLPFMFVSHPLYGLFVVWPTFLSWVFFLVESFREGSLLFLPAPVHMVEGSFVASGNREVRQTKSLAIEVTHIKMWQLKRSPIECTNIKMTSTRRVLV